jgi:hypothetical protein
MPAFTWYNPPSALQSQAADAALTFSVGAKTDYWRVTRHDFIKDDAPFYYQHVTGDFVATVKVTGQYAALYDQAGLMVRENAETWLKCGIEYLDGVQQASAVITRHFSDWSVMPLADNPTSVWVRVERTGSAFEVYVSRDGSAFTLIRQGYLTETSTVQVGMMAAAPTGNGFDVTFEGFTLELTRG